MKLLILSIYSNDKKYNEMLKIQRSYVHQYPNVNYYFICLRKQTNLIEIEKDIIYVKGEEALLNITYKTIEALNYALQHIEFDYMIRTNMSTIINIPALIKYCSSITKKSIYTGGNFMSLQWFDYKSGIKDKKLFGTNFFQGTSIIMSKNVVSYLVKHRKKIRYDIVDDIAFGLFIATYLPSAFVTDKLITFEKVPKNVRLDQLDKHTIFFRNRDYNSSNRKGDIKNMRSIRSMFNKNKFTRKKIKVDSNNPS
jgi:hypothetical protein